MEEAKCWVENKFLVKAYQKIIGIIIIFMESAAKVI